MIKTYYLVRLDNVEHQLAFLGTEKTSLADQWDVIGKDIHHGRERHGLIFESLPVCMKRVVLADAKDSFLMQSIGFSR